MSQRKTSLLIIGVVLLAVATTFILSERISAPEPSGQPGSSFNEGEEVKLTGELVCLPHRDQSGPQTMECAFGFLDQTGTYYGVQDSTPDYSLISGAPMNQTIEIEGVYHLSTDEKYLQNGMIEIRSIIE